MKQGKADQLGPKGLFVVLEGGEGVGKTTQWTRLADALRELGHSVFSAREPGGTATGDVIRGLLLDPSSHLTPSAEALLFAASRAQLVADKIRPALANGSIVLVDRFLLSTYAYQGAGRGIALEELHAINHLATDGLTPDMTLLLSVPIDVAMARMKHRGPIDRLERESDDFHQRVRAAFDLALNESWQSSHPEVGPVVSVPAHDDVDAVTVRCLDVLVQRWPRRFSHAAHTALNGMVKNA